jgi:hypothetical protein
VRQSHLNDSFSRSSVKQRCVERLVMMMNFGVQIDDQRSLGQCVWTWLLLLTWREEPGIESSCKLYDFVQNRYLKKAYIYREIPW